MNNESPSLAAVVESIASIREQMERSIIGHDDVVESILICLLVNGNLLLEGLPGTAKTRAVKSLAAILDVKLSRIQFTPDLLPSDITGTEVYHHDGGAETLRFEPGPLFANLVLADEINRAPAKVQAALLEAMEERQVTVAGQTYAMPDLFMVLATQNPIEQEGTYPLPEAQMDRFVMKCLMDYPDAAAECAIIRLVRGEEFSPLAPVSRIDPGQIVAARRYIHDVYSSENIERYMVDLVMATRKASGELARLIDVGASPRASIALDRCSRAHAFLRGRDFVEPADVRAVVHPVMRHRLIISYDGLAEGVTPDQLIDRLLRDVAVV